MSAEESSPRYMPPEPLPCGGMAGARRSADRRPTGHDLGPPPRAVPILVRLAALVGGATAQFGWAFFGFGMVFVWVFFPAAEWESLVRFRGEMATVTGAVVACEETNCKENETRVYAIHYAFTAADGTERTGVSYATGSPRSRGDAVVVEHPKGDPSASRIQGLRRSTFNLWASFVAIFPLVGLAFIVVGLARGIKANRLLAHGNLARGVLRDKQPTNVTVNNRRVYRLTFAFTAEDGRTFEAVARTSETERLEDDPEERILYDPWNPRYAAMLDNLPGGPEIDEAGCFQPKNAARNLAVLILPLMTLAGHGLYVYFRFAG